MTQEELKGFLDEKVLKYNNPKFIASDPIQIPHQFTIKEDIEIAAFLTATIAWGNRKMIIKNAESNITNTNRLSNFQNKVLDFLETELELDLSKSNILPFKLMEHDAGQNAQYFTKHRIRFEIQTNPRYMEQIKAYYAEDIKLYNQ